MMTENEVCDALELLELYDMGDRDEAWSEKFDDMSEREIHELRGRVKEWLSDDARRRALLRRIVKSMADDEARSMEDVRNVLEWLESSMDIALD